MFHVEYIIKSEVLGVQKMDWTINYKGGGGARIGNSRNLLELHVCGYVWVIFDISQSGVVLINLLALIHSLKYVNTVFIMFYVLYSIITLSVHIWDIWTCGAHGVYFLYFCTHNKFRQFWLV